MEKQDHVLSTPVHHVVQSLTVMCVGGFLLELYRTQALALYIRPDYNVFTVATGLFLVLVSAVSIFTDLIVGQRVRQPSKIVWTSESWKEVTNAGLLIFLLLGCVLLPRHSLSADSAARRGVGQNILTSSSVSPLTSGLVGGTQQENPLFFSTNSNKFTIVDWVRSFSVNPEPESYRDRSVSADGFVQPNTDGSWSVARFVISCCAVDATPIALPVDQPIGSLKADDWVHVEGKFTVKDTGGVRRVVVAPSKVQKIAQPNDPYLY